MTHKPLYRLQTVNRNVFIELDSVESIVPNDNGKLYKVNFNNGSTSKLIRCNTKLKLEMALQT